MPLPRGSRAGETYRPGYLVNADIGPGIRRVDHQAAAQHDADMPRLLRGPVRAREEHKIARFLLPGRTGGPAAHCSSLVRGMPMPAAR